MFRVKKLFPLKLTQRFYLWTLVLIVVPTIGLTALTQHQLLEHHKQERAEQLYRIAGDLQRRMPGSFSAFLEQEGAAGKPVDVQVQALNRILQPIVDALATARPNLSMGYFSMELDRVVAIAPYNPDMLRAISHATPYFNVYKTGRPASGYYDQTFEGHSGRVLYQSFPIYDNGRLVGHTWARYKMDDILAEAGAAGRNILWTGSLILALVVTLSWVFFTLQRRSLEAFSRAVTQEGPEFKEQYFPELRSILGLVTEHSDALNLEIVQRKEAQERAERQASQLSALLDASSRILAKQDLNKTGQAIFDSCKNLLGATAGYIALRSEDGADNEVILLDVGGHSCSVDPSLPMPVRGLREQAYRFRQAVFDNSFPQTEWVQFLPPGHVQIENVLFAPLIIRGEAVGLIGLANKPGGFDENDLTVAAAFADLAAIALHNSRLLDALTSSHQETLDILESITDGFMAVDKGWAITYANTEALRLVSKTREELNAANLFESYPLLSTPNVRGKLSKALSEQIRVRFQEFWAERWFEGNAYPSPQGLSVYFRDITRRKHTEETLRRREREFETLVENTPDIIVRLDRELHYMYSNPANTRVFGAGQDLHGKSIEDAVSPETALFWRESLEDVFKSGEERVIEYGFPSLDGVRYLQSRVVPEVNADGDVETVLIAARDITELRRAQDELRKHRDHLDQLVNERTMALQQEIIERQQAEEALKRERRRLFSLLEELPASVHLTAQDNSIRFANRAFRQQFGDPRGKNCDQVLHGLDAPCSDCPTFHVFGTGLPQHREWQRYDGRVYHVYDYPFSDVDGTALILEMLIDITDLRQAEKERQLLREREARTQRLTSLATMSAGIAHEIGQPLNAIRLLADQMLYWHEQGVALEQEQVVDKFKRISEQTVRITEITQYVRSFADLKPTTDLQPCNLNNAVNNALKILGSQLSAHSITVKRELAKQLHPILGNENRLDEVVINLLVNAMEALDQADRLHKTITCRTRMEDNNVILEIEDNADGLTDEVHKKLFEPFFSTKSTGMGMGLSIVQSIVESFDGSIDAHNSGDGGAIFRLAFPKANSARHQSGDA